MKNSYFWLWFYWQPHVLSARRLKFQLFITDIKNQAMLRMKNIIFPKRYKNG